MFLLVPAHLGSSGQRALNSCVCVLVGVYFFAISVFVFVCLTICPCCFGSVVVQSVLLALWMASLWHIAYNVISSN